MRVFIDLSNKPSDLGVLKRPVVKLMLLLLYHCSEIFLCQPEQPLFSLFFHSRDDMTTRKRRSQTSIEEPFRSCEIGRINETCTGWGSRGEFDVPTP